MSVFKSLQFADIDALANGVHISGPGAYNAPKREAELVAIPGRNGDVIVDNGRFENIEVTYPAGIVGDDGTAMRDRFRQFRSLLLAKRGYHRLVDEYNPDEFRLGTFIDGIEAEATGSGKGAEFELKFNCKPQRFLMSGESAIPIQSGDKIYNPTPFEASPLMMVRGYGNIALNNYNIALVNETIGKITVARDSEFPFTVDVSQLNQGDKITLGEVEFISDLHNLPSNAAVTVSNYSDPTRGTYEILDYDGYWYMFLRMNDLEFTYNRSGSPQSVTSRWGITVRIVPQSGTPVEAVIVIIATITYTGNRFTATVTYQASDTFKNYIEENTNVAVDITAVSSISTLGDPTYIDCDLGEVYKIENDSVISLNRLTDLGSYLPVLSPGENLIEYDPTITSLELVPRWWLL